MVGRGAPIFRGLGWLVWLPGTSLPFRGCSAFTSPWSTHPKDCVTAGMGWMDGWLDGWLAGWTDGWMDRRMDGRMQGHPMGCGALGSHLRRPTTAFPLGSSLG